MRHLASALILLLAGCASPSTDTPGGDLPAVTSFVHIHALSVDPQDSRNLVVATHRGVIQGRDDATWKYAGSDLSDYMGYSAHPVDNRTAYSSGHPTAGGNQGIRKTTDGGATWTTIALAGQVDCHAMTVSRADPNRIYCADSGGRFYRSTDGATFQQFTPTGLAPPVFAFAASSTEAQTVYAGTPTGVFVSADGASTWSKLAGSPSAPVSALATHPTNGQELLAFFAGNGPRLQRSTDGGATWSAAGDGLPASASIAALAYEPQNTTTVYGAGGTTIYKTTGQAWTTIRTGA